MKNKKQYSNNIINRLLAKADDIGVAKREAEAVRECIAANGESLQNRVRQLRSKLQLELNVPHDHEPVSPVDTDFNIGDVVTFTNEFGVSFPGQVVTGYADEDCMALLSGRTIHTNSSCWWFPVHERELNKQA